MIINKISKNLSILFASLVASSAFASSQTDMKATAKIEKSCSIKSYDINFGVWHFTEGNIGRNSTIDVFCNKGTPYVIGGSEHGGAWPYQGSSGSWTYVIKMSGTSPGNNDWLAYRIHIGAVNPLDYNTQAGNILGMGNVVHTGRGTKTSTISAIGDGSVQQHQITGILFGNDTPESKRFIGVKADTYKDVYTLTVTY